MTSDRPTGTVTFLFTDIEGSTELAQQNPDALPAALARHHFILNQTIEAHHGYVFQIIGDSFHAAFPTAPDAFQAALDAQRLLQHEAWNPAPIKVRMGINTGAAQAVSEDDRSGGYTGYATLARVQRVMSTAYGGQVLLSNASADLVQSELPAGVTLRDMGEHRFKGLTGLDRLWQLVAPDLLSDFPPLKTAAAVPNNLPTQLTSFIGREHELADIKHLLLTTHLLTLTGSGGTGKTRLSLQTAAEMLDSFADGAWFIELAPIADPALVPQTIAMALGVKELPGHSTQDLVLDYLRPRQPLLILDNCEHLIHACAQLANQLLHACPQLRILASSREALGIDGEHAYRVPSLSIDELRHQPALDAIKQNECVQLFVERASAADANFQLNAKNAAAVAQICLRLDGIPLAIELAAARVKVFTPDQIAARLDNRFRLLTGGSRTALPRQQTLRALIDWSYDLLPEAERSLLRRLSVFVDGWTFEAAEAVCAGDASEAFDILDLLTHLVEKSLVSVDRSDEAGTRYRLLETVRQYARDKLLDSGEVSSTRDRHLDYFLNFGDEAYEGYFGAEQPEWRRRVQAEGDNVRAAFEWALDHQPEAAIRLIGDVSIYWGLIGYASEGVRLLQLGLDRVAALPPAAGGEAARQRQRNVAHAQLHMAGMLIQRGDPLGARHYAEECLLTWRALGVQREWGMALRLLAVSAVNLGDADTALPAVEEAIVMFRALNEPRLLATALSSRAMIFNTVGRERATSYAYVTESIELFRTLGDEEAAAFSYWVLGHLELSSGNYPEARTAFEASLSGYLKAGSRTMVNSVRSGLAGIEWHQEHYDAALKLYRGVIAEWQQLDNLGAVARCLECVAFIWLHQAENAVANQSLQQAAACLLGAAEHLREIIHAPMNPIEQSEYQDHVTRLRHQMDEARLTAAWSDGRGLTMDQAIALAVTG